MRKACEREGCDQDFAYHPDNKVLAKQRFCSRRCWLKVNNTPEQSKMGTNSPRWREHWDTVRGTGKRGWYVKEGGRHQHRVVAEQMIGRPLLPKEVVHHKDGNKANNDPSNLQVFSSQAEHARHHMTEKSSDA